MQLHTHFLFVFDERFEWDDNKREFSDKTWNQLPVGVLNFDEINVYQPILINIMKMNQKSYDLNLR